MHLDLERKTSVVGGESQSAEPAQHNHNNNNNNNINNSNTNNQYQEGEVARRLRDNDNNQHEEEQSAGEREITLTTPTTTRTTTTSSTRRDVAMRELEERNKRVIEPPESTTILEKLTIGENGDVIKPMLEKKGIIVNGKEGKKMYQYLSTLIAGHMAMQSGMTLGWTSPILPYFQSKDSFLPDRLTDEQESWICSLLALGAVLGAVPAGKVADRIGRKAAIIATALPFLISWIMLIFCRDLTSIYIARFIGGIGAGAACVLVPVYIGEVAEASIRGALGSFFPLLFSLGIVFVYVSGAYSTYTIFNVTCCLQLVPFFATIYFLPESPMWLVRKNRMKQAGKSLAVLRGKVYDPKYEISLLHIEAERMENRRGGIRDLVGTRAGRKALVTCVGLMWFQQMSGIDAVLFYTTSIFGNAGSTIDPAIATIIIGIVEVVMSIVVAAVIDRFGRKPLLILSGTAMTLCLCVLGYYFKMQEDGKDVSSIGWLPLTSLSLFNVVFSLGYGSVPFAIISELFPPETKGVASSISIMTNWILVFTVTKIFPTMGKYMGQAGTFWCFGFMCAMSAVFAYFLVPETKGKTLQEIQTKLEFRKSDKKKAIAMEPA